jgi:hypothetical protein
MKRPALVLQPKFTPWTPPFFYLLLFFFFVIQVGAAYTVIRFVSISAKLGLCTILFLNLGVNGTIIEAKIHRHLNAHFLAST